ncbi:hypothetical protein BC831DRAFT_440585 [Entophlyctis helioformis]|nr:hypothetical protein BC831DRAFT_440585 [Entophlyctis helioformis]
MVSLIIQSPYTLTYAGSLVFDLALLCFWAASAIRNRVRGFHLSLFDILTAYLVLKIIEDAMSVSSMVCFELQIDATNLYVATNLVSLASVACFYGIQALICKGLSVTRSALLPTEQQIALVVGLSMTIVDLLASGSTQIYSISLVCIIIVILRLLLLQLDRNIHAVTVQLETMAVRPLSPLALSPLISPLAFTLTYTDTWNTSQINPSVPRGFLTILQQKIVLLSYYRLTLISYMTSSVVIHIAKFIAPPVNVFVAEKIALAMALTSVFWLFRIQRPTEVRLRVGIDGRLIVTVGPFPTPTVVTGGTPAVAVSPTPVAGMVAPGSTTAAAAAAAGGADTPVDVNGVAAGPLAALRTHAFTAQPSSSSLGSGSISQSQDGINMSRLLHPPILPHPLYFVVLHPRTVEYMHQHSAKHALHGLLDDGSRPWMSKPPITLGVLVKDSIRPE